MAGVAEVAAVAGADTVAVAEVAVAVAGADTAGAAAEVVVTAVVVVVAAIEPSLSICWKCLSL